MRIETHSSGSLLDLHTMASEQFDISYVAHLARIRLSNEEAQKLGMQLQNVLGYIEKLKEVDVANIDPTAHAMPLVNVSRPDQVRPSMPHEDALRNAPASGNG